MKTRVGFLLVAAVLAASVTTFAWAQATAPAKPAATAAPAAPAAKPAAAPAALPALPGLTAKDQNPNGCVSCHKGDSAINKALAKLKHKNVDRKTTTVPDDCNTCHEGDEEIDSLAVVIHASHYSKGEKSEFVTKHGGQCLHCHAMKADTGEVTVKKGAKNW